MKDDCFLNEPQEFLQPQAFPMNSRKIHVINTLWAHEKYMDNSEDDLTLSVRLSSDESSEKSSLGKVEKLAGVKLPSTYSSEQSDLPKKQSEKSKAWSDQKTSSIYYSFDDDDFESILGLTPLENLETSHRHDPPHKILKASLLSEDTNTYDDLGDLV